MLIILKKYANNDGVPGESPESRQRRTFMRHWGINYIRYECWFDEVMRNKFAPGIRGGEEKQKKTNF